MHGSPSFSFKDLAAALALGVFAGLGARAFAWMLNRAKQITSVAAPIRIPIAGAALTSKEIGYSCGAFVAVASSISTVPCI